jgi:hypothetical protein
MFLKDKATGDLVEVLDIKALADPFQSSLQGRFHVGEEMPDPQTFEKANLVFPSDEPLPRCWVDSQYRQSK